MNIDNAYLRLCMDVDNFHEVIMMLDKIYVQLKNTAQLFNVTV